MTQYGFYVNTDICTGCKACMTACFDRNNLEVPQKFRKVWEFGGGEFTPDDPRVLCSATKKPALLTTTRKSALVA